MLRVTDWWQITFNVRYEDDAWDMYTQNDEKVHVKVHVYNCACYVWGTSWIKKHGTSLLLPLIKKNRPEQFLNTI